MTKILAIIQARMGSSRLPNKVLKDLCGKTDLERVIERVRKSKLIDTIVVATTIAEHDLPIVQLCSEKGIRVFIGSEDDVLDRYYQCAKLLNPEYVVRITSDCPLIDPEIIDRVISTCLNDNSDYASNTLDLKYPDGLDCEIMKYSVLEEAWVNANLTSQREHVTQYIVHNDKFSKTSIVSPIDYGKERWTLDTENDYQFIKAVYEGLYHQNPDFNMNDILEYLSVHPDLRRINNDSVRNEGLLKSLKNDKEVGLHNTIRR